MSATITTAKSIPFLFRQALTTIDPIKAIIGALLTYFAPDEYFDMATHGIHAYSDHTKFLYTTIAGSWLHTAFIEGVVLRSFDDMRVWRLSCAAMLLSDVFFCISSVEAVGGWAVYSQVGKWTFTDWGIFLATAPFVAMRIWIVLGIGMKKTRTLALDSYQK